MLRLMLTRVFRPSAAFVFAFLLSACEHADRFSGGIDLDTPPPVINGSMTLQAPVPTEAPQKDKPADARESAPAEPVALRATGSNASAPSTSTAPSAALATPVAPTASAPTASAPTASAPTASAPTAPPASSSSAPAAGAAVASASAADRELRPVRERSAVLLNADRAFVTRSGCSEAVRLYASVPRPPDLQSPDGTDWVTAQLRIAQCSIELREWNRALDAIAMVKASRPREWSAVYFEGHVYCQMGQFDRGTKTFRDLTGLLGTLGTGARQAVTLLSKYGTASCDRLDYEASRQPERNKDQLDLFLGEYEEFLKGAERMQGAGAIPVEYAREMSTALKSARDNVAKYGKP